MIAEIVFLAIAIFTALCAVMVLRTNELIHATLWLAGMLLGVAGVFLTLGGEFLATIQLLVYIGAVITLILFTVMLTIPEEKVDMLDELDLPPGVHIESVEILQRALPSWTGVGPQKDLTETNPRRPLRKPDTLYGVSLADNEYGSETTDRTKAKEAK